MLRILALLFLIVSCSGDNSDSNKKKSDLSKEEVRAGKSLVRETDELLLDINQERIFTTATEIEAQAIRESLTRIKNSILRLINGENPKTVFKVLKTYLKRLEDTDLLFLDAVRVFDYKSDLYSYISKLAKKYNIDLDKLDWVLYDYRFSKLWPFTTTSTSGDWTVDWSLGASYTRVRGWGNRAWLISPLMDFTGTKNPRIKIHHMLMVDGDKRSAIPFDRNLILENAFKIMVSTNYESGDPESAEWREVKLTGYPEGLNFHSTWSDEIPLGKINTDNVTIALLYDMNDRILGRHYVSWQVNKFLILGQSDTFSVTERSVKTFLYQDGFTERKLGLNKSVSTGVEFPWVDFGMGGATEFAKIEASVPNVDTWLMTPKIKLDTGSAVLKLKEVARNLDRENFKLKVSTNYNGGDPKKSTWVEFDHIPADYSGAPGAWVNFKSVDIDLAQFLGKEIVIGFQYINPEGNHTAWEIDEILIDGDGEELEVTELNITYENPNVIADVEGVTPFYEHNFKDGLGEFDISRSEDNSAVFEVTTRREQTYVTISGHKQSNNGVSKILSPAIKLSEKDNYIKVEHAINFLKGEARSENYIKVYLLKVTDQTGPIDQGTPIPLEFQKSPTGSSWDAVESEWLLLKDDLKGSDVRVVFEYRSNAELKLFPGWNIYNVKLGEKE